MKPDIYHTYSASKHTQLNKAEVKSLNINIVVARQQM
jgi:hypothetical protein